MGSQPKAYLDHNFLKSEDARPIRLLAEYLEPQRRFKLQNIQDTVVFFGSARIHSREAAQHALEALMRTHAVGSSQEVEEIVARGRRAVEWSRYYEEARELAYMLTEWSLGLDTTHHRFVVTSGGGPGIMEAANRGATEAGGKTIGLNISLPHEQGPNPYITDDLHFEFHYFFMRKFWFAYLAKAIVVFPGGFGTLDELFEILTLEQTRKLDNRIQILLYGTDYWDRILTIEPMVEWGAVGPDDPKLLRRVNSVDEAFAVLQEGLSAVLASETEAEQAPKLAATRK